MPHVRAAHASLAVLVGIAGIVVLQQVSAEPAPTPQTAAVLEDPKPPRVWPSTTTTAPPTTTTAPPPPPTEPPPPPPKAATRAKSATSAPPIAASPPPAPAPPPATASVDGGAEAYVLDRLNQDRAANGRSTLGLSGGARSVARDWASYMAAHSLTHNPDLGGDLNRAGVSWRVIGENVGQGQSASQIYASLKASGSHWNRMMSTEFTQIGVGVVNKGGTLWLTIDFVG